MEKLIGINLVTEALKNRKDIEYLEIFKGILTHWFPWLSLNNSCHASDSDILKPSKMNQSDY